MMRNEKPGGHGGRPVAVGVVDVALWDASNTAAGLGLGGNGSCPEVLRPFAGFADGTPVEDGHVRMPDLPGIGFEGESDRFAVLRTLLGRAEGGVAGRPAGRAGVSFRAAAARTRAGSCAG